MGGGWAAGVVVVALGLGSERLTAPFGLTRPVPCARPALARTLVDFVRVVFVSAG